MGILYKEYNPNMPPEWNALKKEKTEEYLADLKVRRREFERAFIFGGEVGKAYWKEHGGVEQVVARQAHNLEVDGSSPSPATGPVSEVDRLRESRPKGGAESSKVSGGPK